jgi:uncharacterized protein involved in type VI secretion and phage assembly
MSDFARRNQQEQRSEFFGKYRGQVVENVDPEQRGRLQVQVPSVLGDLKVWALPCVPYVGKSKGLFLMPDKKVGVWVEFEAGNPSFPIWSGCFWNEREAPEKSPAKKILKTDKFTLTIDDEAEEVRLENTSGSEITITSLDITVKSQTLKLQAGKNGIVIDNVKVSVNDGAFEAI